MKRKILETLALCLFAVLSVPMAARADIVDVYWNGQRACWSDSDEDYTERYQVALYRGNNEITRIRTTNLNYNFASEMTANGQYRFRVRAYEDGSYNGWSEYSQILTVQGSNTNSSGNSISSQSSPSGSANTSNIISSLNINYTPYREGWYLGSDGSWHYRYSDGTEPKDTFALIDGRWYNFTQNGSMRTGWFQRGGSWFYLKQDGAMALGWRPIDGKWYYFSPEDGAMLTNSATPDGYWVGADGVWVQA